MSKIIELKNRLNGISVKDYFNYLRLQYLKKELSKDPDLRPYLRRVLGKEPEETINAPDLEGIIADDWSDQKFHLEHRITSTEELKEILNIDEEDINHIVEQGFLLSIPPLTIVSDNDDMLNKFLPKKDFFDENMVKTTDAYGIFTKGAMIYKDGVYVGSQKFPRSVLMNITNICHSGCVGCYKGEYTRVKDSEFVTDLSKATSLQTEKLVEYLNENQKIQAVIMSGGEPLLLPNEGMKKVLEKLKQAEYLSEFRICTGTIFQGLPYRIDDELLDSLKDFQNETGIQVHFNAHLSHPSQFTTDALIAVKKIKDRGFYVNTQVPLQRNVNIFPEDKEKTMQTLYDLTELQGKSGIRPYKYILHMNCGSLEYSVPLEFMLDVLGELKYRPDHPWPETWQPVSVSILCKEGNILLSPQLKYCMEKTVNEDGGYVEYKIPVPMNGYKMATYREPIMSGFNCNQ